MAGGVRKTRRWSVFCTVTSLLYIANSACEYSIVLYTYSVIHTVQNALYMYIVSNTSGTLRTARQMTSQGCEIGRGVRFFGFSVAAPLLDCTSVRLHRHLSTSGNSRNPHHWSEILSCTFRDTTLGALSSRWTAGQGYENLNNPGN